MTHKMGNNSLIICAAAAAGAPNRKKQERYLRLIDAFVRFCQSQGLTARMLLRHNQAVSRATNVFRSDLTEDGYKLFEKAYNKWFKAGYEGRREPEDTSVLLDALGEICPELVPAGKETRRRRVPRRVRIAREDESIVLFDVPKDFELTEEELTEFNAAGPHVYDKADWHIEEVLRNGLNEYQAYVHTGMFVGWLSEMDMLAPPFRRWVKDFKSRLRTGPEIYGLLDGGLFSSTLTKEGNQFALRYYDMQFIKDYRDVLARHLPSVYHVKDTWSNFEAIRMRIAQRYCEWQGKHRRVECKAKNA
jgi:hypothetical protein